MQDGSQDPQLGAMVPTDPASHAVAPSILHGTLMLVLGCIAAMFLPFVGVLLIAYGMRELAEAKGLRGLALALALCAGLVLISLFSDVNASILLAPMMVSCLGVVFCMWRGATVTNISVAIAIAALASFGIDAAIAASSGDSIHDIATSYFADSLRVSAGSDIEGDLLFQQIGYLIEAMWPFMYVSSASLDGLVAGIGSYLMHTRSTGRPKRPSLSNFDAPMWSVGVLSIAIVCLGASFTGFAEAGILRTISATALMSIRIIFACQGFGVVNAWMSRKRIGCATRTLSIFFIFWSEMMFFIMSIVGLIDVWANFRKLPRDGSYIQEQQ